MENREKSKVRVNRDKVHRRDSLAKVSQLQPAKANRQGKDNRENPREKGKANHKAKAKAKGLRHQQKVKRLKGDLLLKPLDCCARRHARWPTRPINRHRSLRQGDNRSRGNLRAIPRAISNWLKREAAATVKAALNKIAVKTSATYLHKSKKPRDGIGVNCRAN